MDIARRKHGTGGRLDSNSFFVYVYPQMNDQNFDLGFEELMPSRITTTRNFFGMQNFEC